MGELLQVDTITTLQRSPLFHKEKSNAVNTSLSEEAQARFYTSNYLTFGIEAARKDKTQRQLLSSAKQMNIGSLQYTHKQTQRWCELPVIPRCLADTGSRFRVFWLFVVRQLAGQLPGSMYTDRGAVSPRGVVINFEQVGGCVCGLVFGDSSYALIFPPDPPSKPTH